MTTRGVARNGHVQLVVPAPVESVWRVVSDVTRVGEWSHECYDVAWREGATFAAPGVRFRGRNRAGLLRWTRQCEVLTVEAPRRLTWRTVPTVVFHDSTDWRITLEQAGSGTRITQDYHLTKAPGWWEWIVARLVPRHIDRSAALTEDLRRLGEVAAGDVRGAVRPLP